MKKMVVLLAVMLVFSPFTAVATPLDLQDAEIRIENRGEIDAEFYVDDVSCGIYKPGADALIIARIGNHILRAEAREGPTDIIMLSIYLNSGGFLWTIRDPLDGK